MQPSMEPLAKWPDGRDRSRLNAHTGIEQRVNKKHGELSAEITERTSGWVRLPSSIVSTGVLIPYITYYARLAHSVQHRLNVLS